MHEKVIANHKRRTQGCQICLGTTIQNGKNIPIRLQKYQTAIKYTKNGHKKQMAMKYTKIFHPNRLPNIPNGHEIC
jgi:hypothetical protein